MWHLLLKVRCGDNHVASLRLTHPAVIPVATDPNGLEQLMPVQGLVLR
jgi:hypothetical protein